MRILLLVALCGVMVLVGSTRAAANAEDPNRPQGERTFSPLEVASDLDALYAGLQSGSFDLYAFTPKWKLDRAYRQLRAELESLATASERQQPAHAGRRLTLFEAKTRLQLLAALAHQGHARVDGPYADWATYRKTGGKGFPINIRVMEGRAYVAENLSGIEAIKRGDEITAINSSPMRQWLERTARHVSAETPYMANSILEYDFPIYLWTEAGDIETFDIDFRHAVGDRLHLRVPALTAAEMDRRRAAQPRVLDLEHPLRDAKVLGDGTGYLRPGPFYNADAKTGAEAWAVEGFKAFIDSAFRRFNAKGVTRLIIDLRGNPGGDNLFSDVMVAWFADRPFRFCSQFRIKVSTEAIAANESRIRHDAAAAGPVSLQYRELYAHAKAGAIVDYPVSPAAPRADERFRGKVFVLIDRHSYSNAVAVAALIQDYKFGVVLGEATADMAATYGAMEQFTLPVTGISVGFPKARIVRPNGDLRARGVTPDIAIANPIVQTADDEVLQSAIRIVSRNK